MLGTLAPLLIKNNDTTYINKKENFSCKIFWDDIQEEIQDWRDAVETVFFMWM